MSTTVLVVSPHPDDESLGCGGTLRTHVAAGHTVDVVFLTSGEAGGHADPPEVTGPRRESEARAAAEVLGLRDLQFWQQPDGALAAVPALVERLVDVLRHLEPDIVYVPHKDEDHPDHRAAAALVEAAVRASEVHANVCYMEVWTPLTQFNHVVDVSAHMAEKLAAIRAHESQCAAMDFASAIEGLNRYRGEMHSWPGGPYAEVFVRWSP